MKRALLTATVAAFAVALVAAAGALALRLEVGKTVIFATAKISPTQLPAKGNAPVEVTSIVKIGNRDGSPPPRLREFVLQFDRNGRLDTRGIPVCTQAKLAGKTTSAARKACRKSIVGKGIGKALVTFPGQQPVKISSPLLLFNGPRSGGMPSLIAHAYERIPEPKALLIPIPIERINKGRYGYRVKITLPEIAGGYGAATLSEATIGLTRKVKGRSVGYANAHCVGGRLQVYGTLSFDDGGFANGTVAQGCRSGD